MSAMARKKLAVRSVGRPTVYRPEPGARFADALATGPSLEAAAAACGIGPRTVFTRQGEHDEFRQAIEDGRTLALLFWENRAIAFAEGAPGNAGLVSHALRNRSRSAWGWVDKTSIEPSGAVQVKTTNVQDVSDLADDELDVLEHSIRKTLAANEQ